MKLNNKGYMLVEIIVASVLAFGIAYYLINLTYKFKDQNMDIYNSMTMLSDKINITKNIMDDIEKQKITSSTCDSTVITLTFDGSVTKKITISDKKKLEYKSDAGDEVFYVKELKNGNEFTSIECNGISSARFGITNIYSDKIYYVNIIW